MKKKSVLTKVKTRISTRTAILVAVGLIIVSGVAFGLVSLSKNNTIFNIRDSGIKIGNTALNMVVYSGQDGSANSAVTTICKSLKDKGIIKYDIDYTNSKANAVVSKTCSQRNWYGRMIGSTNYQAFNTKTNSFFNGSCWGNTTISYYTSVNCAEKPVASAIKGDVNKDGKIDQADVDLILKSDVGLISKIDPSIGDVSGDGVVDGYDAVVLGRMINLNSDIYKQKPTQSDVDQITKDFNIVWLDNPGAGKTFSNGFLFDQSSIEPSKMVIISRLNMLKHETFSEPLPFTNLSIYDYVKKYTSKIEIGLDCSNNVADSNGYVYLNASAGYWWYLESSDNRVCKVTQNFSPYVDQLQLLIHETRHNEPSAPIHANCGTTNYAFDAYLENGSGFSYGAMYLMWVYKYGSNDSLEAKATAKSLATTILKTRFCIKPTHSNPKVQAIIDELYQQ